MSSSPTVKQPAPNSQQCEDFYHPAVEPSHVLLEGGVFLEGGIDKCSNVSL